MNSRERRVQRAFQGLIAVVCSACNPMSEPALEGLNDRKKGEYFS